MLNYVIKRIIRSPFSCFVTVIIAFSSTFMLGRLNEVIRDQNKQLEVVYDNMKIKCDFTDSKGKADGIFITNTIIDVCTTENYRLSQFISDPLFKRSLNYRTESVNSLLVGVNSNRIVDLLSDISDDIFQSSDYIIVVNDQSGYAMGDKVNLTVQLEDVYDEVEFTVAGTYSNNMSDVIYCPWNVVCDLAIKLGGQVSAESGSFTLSNNYRLNEFKTLAQEYFSRVDISGDGKNTMLGLSLVIHDNKFQTTSSSLMRNINMLNILLPIYYILSLIIGFLVSFILIRHRYKEFNLLRCIGTKSYKIIGTALFEQFIFALFGVGLGIFLNKEIDGLLLFTLYIFGAFISVLLVFCRSIMRARSD